MRKLGTVQGLAMVGFVASVAACGSSSGGGGNGQGLNSGVAQSKQGQDVTEEEAQAVCEAANDYVAAKSSSKSFLLSTCKLTGLIGAALTAGQETTAAQLQEACELFYDACAECVDHPDMEGCEMEPLVEGDAECDTAVPPETCTSTVGEIETCLVDLVDSQLATFQQVPGCSELTPALLEEGTPEIDEEPPLPASCETVEENCPEVLEEDTTDETTMQ